MRVLGSEDELEYFRHWQRGHAFLSCPHPLGQTVQLFFVRIPNPGQSFWPTVYTNKSFAFRGVSGVGHNFGNPTPPVSPVLLHSFSGALTPRILCAISAFPADLITCWSELNNE